MSNCIPSLTLTPKQDSCGCKVEKSLTLIDPSDILAILPPLNPTSPPTSGVSQFVDVIAAPITNENATQIPYLFVRTLTTGDTFQFVLGPLGTRSITTINAQPIPLLLLPISSTPSAYASINRIPGASISTDYVTLPPGFYQIECMFKYISSQIAFGTVIIEGNSYGATFSMYNDVTNVIVDNNNNIISSSPVEYEYGYTDVTNSALSTAEGFNSNTFYINLTETTSLSGALSVSYNIALSAPPITGSGTVTSGFRKDSIIYSQLRITKLD